MNSALGENLREMERTRERYWLRYPHTSPVRLRWRAITARHCLHLLPGQSILEIGAGTGLWTEHLAQVLRYENPITAGVFNADYAERVERRNLAGVRVMHLGDMRDLADNSFDFVVGSAILCHNLYPDNLGELYRVLRPGGQILFFEANYSNPQVFLKDAIPALGRWAGQARCQVAMRRGRLLDDLSRHGFANVEVVPYDIIHPRAPRFLIRGLQSMAFVLEHTPGVRQLCGTLYIWARKPGGESRALPSLAFHRRLYGTVSVVVPCRNEAPNLPRLVTLLDQLYGPYIAEFVIVDDNSADDTAAVAREMAARDTRIKLITRRPPSGVGRALRDGYEAASGEFVLSMDADFLQVAPELRDLFDAVADGADGAIGSRFSNESVLINYPFPKIVANRLFHMLVTLFLVRGVRDITNNLKLYRANIIKSIPLQAQHFAANFETGILPLLAGYKIREVPASWINRTPDMGTSSFHVLRCAPEYFRTLLRVLRGRRKRPANPRERDAETDSASSRPLGVGR